jgi:catechol 2,3-dioxygenase-like lactoylglutathione lyase family enzyme
MSPKSFTPRINHVAISVDARIMDEEGRAALLDFYSNVFGWVEGDNSTEKGNPLILYTGSLGQFLYLLPAKDEFMVTPNMDHFGIEVSSKEELLEVLDRVKAYQAKDDRVRVTDVGAMVTRYQDKQYTLTNAYIWFLIPLWIELQHVENMTTWPRRD